MTAAERPVSRRIVSGVVRAMDIAIAMLSGSAAYFMYLEAYKGGAAINLYFLVMLTALVLQANIFHYARLYEFSCFSNLPRQIGRLAVAWLLVFLVLIAAGFLTKTSAIFSRGWTVIWFVSGSFGLAAGRIALYYLVRRWSKTGMLTRNVVVIGAGENGRRFLEYVNRLPSHELCVLGVFDDRKDRVPDIVEGHSVLGSVDDLIDFTRRTRIDEILVALPWSADERLLDIMKKLRVLPVDVRLSPDMIGFHLYGHSFERIGRLGVVSVFDKPLSDWRLLKKDIEDRLLAAAIVTFILPLLSAIALLIKLESPGPILFRQKRYGFNNQIIDVIKFRTMYVDAGNDATVPQATYNDPRVTRVGRFLRRSSLDELPQIFNVLKGEMSLVGPRPHAIPHNQYYDRIIDEYASRHRMKPGITGWAQVNGWRGETDTIDKMQKRVEHDIYYIDNWSIFLDLKILLMTVYIVFTGKNAY